MEVNTNEVPPVAADLDKAGAFYYEFTSNFLDEEGNPVKHYINLGADVSTIIKEALDGKDGAPGTPGEDGNDSEISKIIKDAIDKYLSGKNNVYYGDIDEDDNVDKKVLYEIVNDVKTPIDIAASVRDVFHKIIEEGDSTFNEIIKEAAGDKVAEDGTPVFTGDYVGEFKVYKTLSKITVDGEYDSEFKAGEFVAAPEYVNVLNVSIYDEVGNVVVNSITDIDKSKEGGIRFAFGTGNMYTPLNGGTYYVLLEYVSSVKKDEEM